MSAPDRAHRSAVRTAGFTLAAATIVSLGGNVQHALISENDTVPLWFALAWAAVPPLALPLAVHLAGTLGRAAAGRGRRVVMAGVMAAAVLAFGISFYALRDLTAAMGYPDPVAVAVPVLIDVLAALATAALLVLDRPGTDAVPHPVSDPTPAPEPCAERTPMDAAPAAVGTGGRTGLTSDDTDGGTAQPPTVPAGPGAVPRGVPAAEHRAQADRLVAAGRTTAAVDAVAAVLALSAGGASVRNTAAAVGMPATGVQRIRTAAAEMETEAVGVG